MQQENWAYDDDVVERMGSAPATARAAVATSQVADTLNSKSSIPVLTQHQITQPERAATDAPQRNQLPLQRSKR